jgi:lambda family phage tail tape measure protein
MALSEMKTPEGLFRLNMLAYQNAPPSTNWREKPTIAINPNTGDILGYTIQSAYTDAEKYRAALDELETRFAAGEISSEGYEQALRELAEQYDTGTKLAKQFGDAILITTVSSLTDEFYNLGEAIADGANAWTSFGDAMSDTLEKILVMLPKLAVQAGLQMLTDINPANDTLGLALIGGGLVGSIGAGLLKSNALGDVYTSPSLHQYANGVYNNPQLFTFAKGGVFAEAGPEAIMPLARDSTGKLGVSAKATGNIDIQINNYSSTPIASKTQTITDASGNKKIILTLRDIVRQEIASANAGGVRKS